MRNRKPCCPWACKWRRKAVPPGPEGGPESREQRGAAPPHQTSPFVRRHNGSLWISAALQRQHGWVDKCDLTGLHIMQVCPLAAERRQGLSALCLSCWCWKLQNFSTRDTVAVSHHYFCSRIGADIITTSVTSSFCRLEWNRQFCWITPQHNAAWTSLVHQAEVVHSAPLLSVCSAPAALSAGQTEDKALCFFHHCGHKHLTLLNSSGTFYTSADKKDWHIDRMTEHSWPTADDKDSRSPRQIVFDSPLIEHSFSYTGFISIAFLRTFASLYIYCS